MLPFGTLISKIIELVVGFENPATLLRRLILGNRFVWTYSKSCDIWCHRKTFRSSSRVNYYSSCGYIRQGNSLFRELRGWKFSSSSLVGFWQHFTVLKVIRFQKVLLKMTCKNIFARRDAGISIFEDEQESACLIELYKRHHTFSSSWKTWVQTQSWSGQFVCAWRWSALTFWRE